MGKGKYGSVKQCNLNGSVILIKEFLSKGEEGLEWAKREQTMHCAFYESLAEGCQAYFSQPVKVALPESTDADETVYTAQLPLHNPGNRGILPFAELAYLLKNEGDVKYVLECASAIIRCMDKNQIYHNDISEKNIVVIDESPPTLRVIDFGMARLKKDDETQQLTKDLSIQFARLFSNLITHKTKAAFQAAATAMSPSNFSKIFLDLMADRKLAQYRPSPRIP